MKKPLIILSSLVIVLTFAVSGFSKEAGRKLAQNGVTERVIGSVTAVEKTFVTSFDACAENTEFENHEIRCTVNVFPETGEEIELSNSLDDIDARVFVRPAEYVDMRAYDRGYLIVARQGTITKEEFLSAAQKLINKFPEISVKLLKVVH